MPRRPNDEKIAFDEQVQALVSPGKDEPGKVSIARRRSLALNTCRTARHNLKYSPIMPQPQR
jgi:hypothetical protein